VLTFTGFDESGLVCLCDGNKVSAVLFDAGFPEVDFDFVAYFNDVQCEFRLAFKGFAIDHLNGW
jgi:hypothetical protein